MMQPTLRRVVILSSVVTGVLSLGVGGAVAQGADSPSRLRLGSVSIAPTLVVRNIGVDSNIYNAETPTSDLTFTVVPTFVVTAGQRWANLTVRSATDLVYYARQSSERSVNQDLRLTVRATTRRVSPYVDVGYVNTRQRFNEEVDARARRTSGTGEAGLQVRLFPKLTTGVAVRGVRSAFDGDEVFNGVSLARELNRTTAALVGNLRYAITPLTSVTLDVDRERANFIEDEVRDSWSQRVQVGVETTPRALIAGSARFGLQRFRPDSIEIPRFNGVIGSVAVIYRVRPSTTLGATFDRSLSYSYSAAVPYFVRSGYGLSLRRQLVRRWDVELSGARNTNEYRAVRDVAASIFDGRAERFVDGTVTAGFEPRTGTRISASVAYRRRASEFDDRNYDSVRTGVTISYGF